MLIPTHRVSTHPGEILLEEFMGPLDLSINRLARMLRVPPDRVSKLVKQERSVTVDTAMRLARLFGTTQTFWLNLQMAYDLSKAQQEMADRIKREVIPYEEDAA